MITALFDEVCLKLVVELGLPYCKAEAWRALALFAWQFESVTTPRAQFCLRGPFCQRTCTGHLYLLNAFMTED